MVKGFLSAFSGADRTDRRPAASHETALQVARPAAPSIPPMPRRRPTGTEVFVYAFAIVEFVLIVWALLARRAR